MLGRSTVFCAAVLGLAGVGQSAMVWQSTFDTTADGVVDLFDNNAGKVMIGGNTGGRQQITAWDNTTNAFTPDKAGRPLGSTQGGNSSFSGLYEFSWSTFNQVEAQAYEIVGFLGNASPQTRQVLGTVLRHWRVTNTNDYYIGVDIGAGGPGDFGYGGGPSTYLGTNPEGKDYKLAIGYDGASHVLSASLYDSAGALIVSNSRDLDTFLGIDPATQINGLALTHLGWSDYTGNGQDRASVWQVDRLTYYNTATEADAAALIPEPSAVAIGGATFALLAGARRRRALVR